MLSERFLTQFLYAQIYHATSKHKSWYNSLVRFLYKSCQENFKHIDGKRKNWKRKKITTLMERKRKNKKWKEKINTCNVNHMEVGEKKSRLTWVRGVSRHVETGLRRARTARRAPRSVLTRDRHNGIALLEFTTGEKFYSCICYFYPVSTLHRQDCAKCPPCL